jgi:hypothetical protein
MGLEELGIKLHDGFTIKVVIVKVKLSGMEEGSILGMIYGHDETSTTTTRYKFIDYSDYYEV